MSNSCVGNQVSDGKCQECDHMYDAIQRVRRNDTQFTIGCNRPTIFMQNKIVKGCEDENDCPCSKRDNCDNCDNTPERRPVQCISGCGSNEQNKIATQKKIQKTVMLSSSEYLMNK